MTCIIFPGFQTHHIRRSFELETIVARKYATPTLTLKTIWVVGVRGSGFGILVRLVGWLAGWRAETGQKPQNKSNKDGQRERDKAPFFSLTPVGGRPFLWAL